MLSCLLINYNEVHVGFVHVLLSDPIPAQANFHSCRSQSSLILIHFWYQPNQLLIHTQSQSSQIIIHLGSQSSLFLIHSCSKSSPLILIHSCSQSSLILLLVTLIFRNLDVSHWIKKKFNTPFYQEKNYLVDQIKQHLKKGLMYK